MTTRMVFTFFILSSVSFGQSLDTSFVKNNLNVEWELEYYLYSDGEKGLLRFGPEDNDSSLLIQRIVFSGYQVSTSEMFKYNIEEKIEHQGFWHFADYSGGVFIDIEIEDFFFQGIYEIKSVDSEQLILIECDKHDDCNELYFIRK